MAGLTVITAAGWFVRPSPALAHGAVPPMPRWPDTLLAWTIDPLPLLALIGAALGYWWLVRRIERRHPRNPVPRTRHWAWMGGLAAVVAALLSPIET